MKLDLWDLVSVVAPLIVGVGFWWFRFPEHSATSAVPLIVLLMVVYLHKFWVNYPRLSTEKKGD